MMQAYKSWEMRYTFFLVPLRMQTPLHAVIPLLLLTTYTEEDERKKLNKA